NFPFQLLNHQRDQLSSSTRREIGRVVAVTVSCWRSRSTVWLNQLIPALSHANTLRTSNRHGDLTSPTPQICTRTLSLSSKEALWPRCLPPTSQPLRGTCHATPKCIYPSRASGGHRDHRPVDGPAPARHPKGASGGRQDALRQQPAPDLPRLPQLPQRFQ